MDLRCDVALGAGYKSAAQLARRITEHWCARELYCAACNSGALRSTTTNTPSTDFICPGCAARYQVKSSIRPPGQRIVDAAYGAMIAAIRKDLTPHLIVLHYTRTWTIENALLVPRFFITESTIEKRKPLAPTARRAGWVGCNILLCRIPPVGRIPIVVDGSDVHPRRVRAQYGAVSKIAAFRPEKRGWLVDIMRIVQDVPYGEFNLSHLYARENELAQLHPHNQNIRPKIRQQLQVLRDLGFIEFRGQGQYFKRAGEPNESINH